jgi:hypothetical protein
MTSESFITEIDRYRAVLNHILPLAIAEAEHGSKVWEEAVVMIDAALAQERQPDANRFAMEL